MQHKSVVIFEKFRRRWSFTCVVAAGILDCDTIASDSEPSSNTPALGEQNQSGKGLFLGTRLERLSVSCFFSLRDPYVRDVSFVAQWHCTCEEGKQNVRLK